MNNAMQSQPAQPTLSADLLTRLGEKSPDENDPLARLLRVRLKLDPVKVWLIAILYFGLVEKLALPYLGGFLNLLDAGIRDWVPHVEALLTGFVEFPIFLAYYLWSGPAVVALFAGLIQSGNFKDVEAYQAFVKQALRSFSSRLWPLLSLGAGLLAILVMHFVFWGKGATVPPWFGDRLYFRLLTLAAIGLVAYTVAQVVIRELLVIRWLRRLWSELGDQLLIHPYHSDSAGGLGGIGKHGLSFFYYVVVVFIFIAMASILPAFLAQSSPDEPFRLRFWSPILLVVSAIYLILVPLLFYLLIWPTHAAMERERDERLSVYSGHLDAQLETAALNAGADRKKLPDILKEVADLKNMRKVILEDYPIWPFDTGTKRLFGLTSSLPTVYSVALFIFELLN